MPGITGVATTYNLPNYVGELFDVVPQDTPLLTAIGGLTGGKSVGAPAFEWQDYDLRPAEDDRQRLEGADAPEATARKAIRGSNVLEIHQEAVEVSYTRQGSTNAVSTDGEAQVTIGQSSVPQSVLAHQIDLQIRQIAQDVEKSFITGKYQNPDDNTKPRRTRGLIEAIKTNTATATELTEEAVLDLMQACWEAGGLMESETRTIIVGAKLKRALSKVFINDKGYKESDRNIGGVNLQTFETDFGEANIMLNRWMPEDTLLAVSLESLAPAFLEVPGKGHFFAEQLAKTGASEKVQLYGEIGLQYGNEAKHGKLIIGQ